MKKKMKNNVGYVYRHWILNDEKIEKSYIGVTTVTVQKRWRNNGEGYSPRKGQTPTKFWYAIQKYGWDSFHHEVLLTIQCDNEEELVFWLKEWEKYYIEKYDSFHNGYNSTLGGEGSTGYKHTQETKNKMSEIHKGEKHHFYGKTGEKAICYGRNGEKHPMYGKHHTDESKKKMSESHKGKMTGEKNPMYGRTGTNHPYYGHKQTPEQIQKKIERASKKVICIQTGVVYNSIKIATEQTGINNIGACCRGIYKSAGKHPITGEPLRWMFYDDYLKIKNEENDN